MTIELYELEDANGRRYSVFSWRARLALAHKRLDFISVPVKISDKQTITFSGQKKVPILRDGDTVVFDSWGIAEYLEDRYPAQPSLFGGEVGRSLAKFFNSWADRQLIGTLFPALMLDNVRRLEADDAAHLRAQIEHGTGKTLEQLAEGRDEAVKQLSRFLDPVRSVLRGQAFLSGSAPAYADYILFSVLQWARLASDTPVLRSDDVIQPWFEGLRKSYDA